MKTSVTLQINSTEDYNNNHSNASTWYWVSRNPGSWANNLKVCVIDAAADQRIAIGTFGLNVGYAVTSSYTTSVAGSGVVTTEIGVLKGIITKVNSNSIDVKITAKASSGDSASFTEASYAEGSVNSFASGFNIKIKDNNDAFVKIEETSVERFYGVVSTGSTVIVAISSNTPLPTTIGAGQFITSVTGTAVTSSTTFVGFGTTTGNGILQNTILLSQSATSSGTVQFVVLNPGSSGETITAPSDWYNEQTLGLTNSTVYWRNIAQRPATSEYSSWKK